MPVTNTDLQKDIKELARKLDAVTRKADEISANVNKLLLLKLDTKLDKLIGSH